MLHERYRTAGTVLAALCCLQLSWAFAETQANQFDLSKVEKQPGRVQVSPGYTTLIDFPAAITNVVTGNGSIFKYLNFGNRVVLSATKSAGQTDLLVTTGGRVALFVVQVDSLGKAPKRYTVTDAAAQPVKAAAAPTLSEQLPTVQPAPRVATPRPAAPVVQAPVVQAPVRPVAPSAAAVTGPKAAELLAKYEAERAILYRADAIDVGAASGGRLVQHINQSASRVTFPAIRAPSSGRYTLRVRYTNGYSRAAFQPLSINSLSVPEVQYPPSGGWDRFATVDVQVTLRQGNNTLRFGAAEGVATLDVLELWGLQNGEAAELPAAPSRTVAPPQVPVTKPASLAAVPATDQRVQIPLTNPGFEQGTTDWGPWWNETISDSPQSVDTKSPHSGAAALSISGSKPYTTNIAKSVKDLPNGTYTYEAWVKSSGGQEAVILFALDYGGRELNLSVPLESETGWTKYSIKDIVVTKGQVQIGIFNKSVGGTHWMQIDDVALYREPAEK